MAMTKQAMLMKPMHRMVHAYPRLGISASKRRGNKTPPMGPAVVTMPVVIVQLLSNQCPINVRLVVQMRDPEIPPRTPKANSK